MKKIICIGLLCSLILVGCSNEDSLNSFFETVKLEASIDNSKSRAAFDEDGDFLWTINDAIGVTTDNSPSTFTKMTMNEGGAGKATATFTGKYMSGTPEGYAVYPYNEGHSMNGTTLNYHFPESYDYTIEDHDYFVSDGTGNSFNPPMWSAISGGKSSFKHLGGVLCVKIADLPAGQDQQLKLISSNKITGDFSVDLSEAKPVLTTSESDENNVVTINYSNASESTRVFYIPVPTGTYSLLTVEFEADGETVSVPFENKVVNARSLKIMRIGEGSIEGGEDNGKIVASVTEIESVLDTTEDNLAVKVTGEVTGTDNNIIIPASLQTETTTFTFAQVAADAKITITEETANSYDGVIIIEVPEGTATSQIEAYVPNGEVYIKQGNVTNLLVSSKDETTIIGAGVEVGTLTVKKGNVRIENGGSVNTINRSEDNDDNVTYVIYESATAPYITLGNDVVLVSEAEWDLKKAIADENTSTYQLQEDIVLVEPLTIPSGKTFTLDLNGKTISQEKECAQSYEMIANNGTLTITGNGKISFKDTGAGDPNFGWGSYTIRNSGSLTVENGTIEHLGEQNFATHMICAIFQYSGSTTIKDGIISTPAYRSARLWSGDMTINGGSFDGQLWVQASNETAKLTINGGTFGPNGKDGSSVFVENVKYKVAFSVTGGTFNTKIGCSDATKEGVKGSVKGGIFTESAKTGTNSNLLAAGYDFEAKEDGTYTLVYDASKLVVTSLAELNDALANNEITTIKFGADLTISSKLSITRDITLDGNDKTLTYTGQDRAIDVAPETNGANLTLKNLTIDFTADYCQRGVNYNTNGKLVLDNVTVEGGQYVTYALNLPSSSSNAQVTINESSLTGRIALNVWGANSTINVTDSHLTSVDKEEKENYAAVSLNNDGTTIANGTVVTITGGSITAKDENGNASSAVRNSSDTGKVNVSNTTTVTGKIVEPVAVVLYEGYNEFYSCMTLNDAIEEALKDGTGKASVKVIKDIELDADNTITIPNGKTLVIDLNGKTISQAKAQTTAYAMITNKGTLTIKDSATDGKITYEDTGNGGEYASNTISNQGVLTLESGTIENTSSETVMNNGYPHAIDVYQGSTTNINGGTVKSANYDCIRMFCNSTTQATTVNISGGNIINRVTFQNPTSSQAGYGRLNITGGTFTSTTGKVNVRLLNFSTDVSNMKAKISGGTFDEGVGISNYSNNWSSNWDWLTIENDAINKVVTKAEELSAAIIKGGKIILANDITVEKWVMFSETKTIGTGQIITVEMNGLTIDGNGHTLTINSIESATNGDLLFDDASNLNISNLTIKYADAVKNGGIGLKSGVISNVKFFGGGNIIYPGTGDIKVEDCTFTNTGDALYFEQERDNLTITGCTFTLSDDENVVLLRGDVKFTNNIVNSGRTVNVVSGSPVVTGNNFNEVRLKVYSAASATISNNTIKTLAFEDNATTYASTFTNNTLSAEAQAALDAMNK